MTNIQEVLSELDEFVDQQVKDIATRVIEILTGDPSSGGTPVLTGWASANWRPFIGAVDNSPIGSKPPEGGSASRAGQQIAIGDFLTNYEKGPVTIANSVPYIVRLNDGTSTQAPPGFVQTAIARATRELS